MKINVAILYGGKTTEHDVSVISAMQAIENIDKDIYNVIPVYISKTGDFYTNDTDYLYNIKNYKNENDIVRNTENVTFVKIKNKTYLRSIEKSIFGYKINFIIDVAFPIVHGTNVEDGNLQGFIHTLNLPLVGPDCLASAISMDKYVMKEYCKQIGIPVIDAIRIDKTEFEDKEKLIARIESNFSYPVIIKPVNLGSSIGIKKANDKQELINGLELAFSFADIILVETAIKNMREINCAVLGDKFECNTSALEEPFGNDEILSFADKYMSGSKNSKCGSKMQSAKLSGSKIEGTGAKGGMASLKRKVPAELDESMANEIRKYAKEIFKYLGCSGVSRIDFIIDKDTNKIYANEINSIPGSLSYYLFEPIGIKYKDLLTQLITIAINNYRNENRLNFVFESSII